MSKVVISEFAGDMERVLVAYIQMVENLPLFLANRFEKSMAGMIILQLNFF